MSKQMRQLAVFAVIHACIALFILILLASGSITLFISNYGVDGNERLYVGAYKSIRIFQDGVEIGNIDPNSTNYAFEVNGDTILLAYPSRVQTLNLEGNILKEAQDPNAKTYAQIQNTGRTVVSPNGNEYKRVASLGWTRIVKNDSEVVYRISVLSFAAKILLWLVAASLFINGILFTRRIHRIGTQK